MLGVAKRSDSSRDGRMTTAARSPLAAGLARGRKCRIGQLWDCLQAGSVRSPCHDARMSWSTWPCTSVRLTSRPPNRKVSRS